MEWGARRLRQPRDAKKSRSTRPTRHCVDANAGSSWARPAGAERAPLAFDTTSADTEAQVSLPLLGPNPGKPGIPRLDDFNALVAPPAWRLLLGCAAAAQEELEREEEERRTSQERPNSGLLVATYGSGNEAVGATAARGGSGRQFPSKASKALNSPSPSDPAMTPDNPTINAPSSPSAPAAVASAPAPPPAAAGLLRRRAAAATSALHTWNQGHEQQPPDLDPNHQISSGYVLHPQVCRPQAAAVPAAAVESAAPHLRKRVRIVQPPSHVWSYDTPMSDACTCGCDAQTHVAGAADATGTTRAAVHASRQPGGGECAFANSSGGGGGSGAWVGWGGGLGSPSCAQAAHAPPTDGPQPMAVDGWSPFAGSALPPSLLALAGFTRPQPAAAAAAAASGGGCIDGAAALLMPRHDSSFMTSLLAASLASQPSVAPAAASPAAAAAAAAASPFALAAVSGNSSPANSFGPWTAPPVTAASNAALYPTAGGGASAGGNWPAAAAAAAPANAGGPLPAAFLLDRPALCLSSIQTELNGIHNLCARSTALNLDRGVVQLQRAEALTAVLAAAAATDAGGAAAVAAARAESEAATRAFRTALDIITLCGGLEKHWAGLGASTAAAPLPLSPSLLPPPLTSSLLGVTPSGIPWPAFSSEAAAAAAMASRGAPS
ncbi:hypothetical protein HYH03_011415 [Edaphochlamys debaryana]|uniref:Uncharacterized protein n=1 Tax=Edaphochlamys debaryana TaxID=47281 RepID=A0A835XUP4_9CHLO|nr:hypothetical protein HYH03_011415 [Edaphochlamys debaryana]|eukprot:KAG2490109.1 hypothetical protein HYH03_011415 [Edaphochlamys debaryana]